MLVLVCQIKLSGFVEVVNNTEEGILESTKLTCYDTNAQTKHKKSMPWHLEN